ncbi:MAG: flagellar basal-body rod protein FlgG [Myxococcales bacterium]
MLRSLYTAATGMEAQQLKMDVIANNLANSSTTGFKRVRAEFQDLLSETLVQATAAGPQGGGQPAPLQVGLGVKTGSTTRSMGQGDMQNTQNPLDLAIEGGGFFRVQRAGGEVAFTRAGNLRVDETGRLVTQHGEIIEPGITVPPETTNIIIRPDGTVLAQLPNKTDPTELGRLQLTIFTNPSALEAIGHNLFQPTGASGQELQVRPGEQGAGQVSQGFLEGANVKAVEEMIDMISTQRSYEMSSKVIQTADQMLQRLTQLR